MSEKKDRFRKVAILAEGHFHPLGSKTANCVIRFAPERVVCVIDSTRRGARAADVLGYGGNIPVVGSLEEALPFAPDSLLIGIAPPGGVFPLEWRPLVLSVIEEGLDVASGLHYFLGDDPELADRASAKGLTLWDLRKLPENLPFLPDPRRTLSSKVVLVAGTDCDVGKMTVSFLLTAALNARGVTAKVAPSGQTGIFLAGRGIPLDRVISDFIVGATSRLISETAGRDSPDVILLEGQGTLLHPVYAAVAMGILFGARADAIVLCHDPERTDYLYFTEPIPDLEDVIRVHEDLAAYVRPAKVIAVPVCSPGSPPESAARAAATIEDRFGIPAEDPIQTGAAKLAEAVISALDGESGGDVVRSAG